jgi:WD40 repeat protein/serine/threonine protein kinase
MAEHKHGDLRRLFDLAIAAAPGDREALLKRECGGDAGLKKRIEAMIAAAEDNRFLASPAAEVPAGSGAWPDGPASAEAATIVALLREGPGTRIGPYKILQLIGEGGFGSVFMAEQERPVSRKVALKIIKLGMDTRQVIARFGAERQALAIMDHPNIARVLDAGATETGRPFFVMELVKGDPIVEYCDKNNLSIQERLELFAQVCNAVQHAHTKGIIHRDIKPTNILVSTQDGRPYTKVIDFGIAKATAGKLTEKTLFTEHKALIGTPVYMSPEQAEGSMDIDTRSDVYSLGVLLYELLTGTTPFTSKELLSAAYGEIQRMIREVEPPKPSTRLSQNADTLASVAAHRHIEPRRLDAIVRGELDWIVMKALEKDRQRRYDTASGLAMDVQRYLAGDAVIAAPPSSTYRMRKFVRRHRGTVVAVAVLFLVLVIGVLGTTLGMVAERRAKVREMLARNEASEATLVALRAKAESDRAHESAELDTYSANLDAAGASLSANEPDRVRARLDACPPKRRGWEWRWLDARSDTSVTVCRGHGSPVMSADFSTDGGRVVTASEDRTARVWNAATGAQLVQLDGHTSRVTRAAFDPQGTRVVTASDDGTARVWDAATGAQLVLLRGHEGVVASAAFSPDGTRIVTASNDCTARVWDAATGEQLALLGGHTSRLTRAAFDPAGTRVVTASYDGTARVWDAATGEQLALLCGHEGIVTSATFSPNGTHVATSSFDTTARVWDAATGKELLLLRGHQSLVFCAAFSRDGTRVVTASVDRTARVWDADTGKELADLHGHSDTISSAAFSPDGTRIVTASNDCTARVWDAATGKELLLLRGHQSLVFCAAFSRDGTRVVTASYDKTARVWDADTGKERDFLLGWGGWVSSAAFSADSARVVTTVGHSGIQVWNAVTGLEIGLLRGGHANWICSASFSPDGAQLLTGSLDKTARIWDASTGKELLLLRGHSDGINWAAFGPDGSRVVTASADRTARVWDTATGGVLTTFLGHTDAVTFATFSPDGSRVVTASRDGTARVWDAVTGKELTLLSGHEAGVTSAVFSLDGSRVVTASVDMTARVWDSATGHASAVLRGHLASVMCAVFSPDGLRIATASVDKTVRVWDAATGKELVLLRGHVGIVRTVAFSPDGTQLVSASDEGGARIWDSVPHRVRYPVIVAVRCAAAEVEQPLTWRMEAGEDLNAIARDLAGDASLSAAVRTASLALVDREMERRYGVSRVSGNMASRLNEMAWPVLVTPNAPPEAVAAALENAQRAAGMLPDDADVVNTLGVAQYRTGSYEEALETLARSTALYAAKGMNEQPADLAFIAMAHFKLGHRGQAGRSLASLRKSMAKVRFIDQAEARGFLHEAESLIEAVSEQSR